MVFDPKTSLRCSRSLLSPLSPALGLVFSFRAISVLPPRSAILATPSSPRCSMSSRSCLRVTPYLLPAAMVRPRLTSFQHELGWTNLKQQQSKTSASTSVQSRLCFSHSVPAHTPAQPGLTSPHLRSHLQVTILEFRTENSSVREVRALQEFSSKLQHSRKSFS